MSSEWARSALNQAKLPTPGPTGWIRSRRVCHLKRFQPVAQGVSLTSRRCFSLDEPNLGSWTRAWQSVAHNGGPRLGYTWPHIRRPGTRFHRRVPHQDCDPTFMYTRCPTDPAACAPTQSPREPGVNRRALHGRPMKTIPSPPTISGPRPRIGRECSCPLVSVQGYTPDTRSQESGVKISDAAIALLTSHVS